MPNLIKQWLYGDKPKENDDMAEMLKRLKRLEKKAKKKISEEE